MNQQNNDKSNYDKVLKFQEEHGALKEFKEDLITEKVVKEFLSSLSKKEPTVNINFKKNDIVIMGIGGHASMCIDILLEQNKFNLVGFIDKIETSDKKHNLNYLEHGQGGLLDVLYKDNFIYISYSENRGDWKSSTSVAKAKFKKNE